MLRGALRFGYLLTVVVWVGAIVCFSFVVAPTLFRTFSPTQAGAVVSAVLAPYYRLGRGAGVLALLGALLLSRGAPARARWRAAACAHALGLAATVWAGSVVYPETQRVRAALEADGAAATSSAQFARLHRRAVGLNGVALVTGLLGLGFAAAALRE